MQKQLIIQPLVGLGEIKFGMSPQEVAEIMNEDEVYEDWMGGNLNNSLFFHGLIFGFDKCDTYAPLKDSKLGEVFIHGREDVILFEKPLDSWSPQGLINYAAEKNLKLLQLKNGDFYFADLIIELSFDDDNKIFLNFFKPDERKEKTCFEKILEFFKLS